MAYLWEDFAGLPRTSRRMPWPMVDERIGVEWNEAAGESDLGTTVITNSNISGATTVPAHTHVPGDISADIEVFTIESDQVVYDPSDYKFKKKTTAYVISAMEGIVDIAETEGDWEDIVETTLEC